MSQSQRRESETEARLRGRRATGERERNKGSKAKGKQNRTDLTHHDALDIPDNRPLSSSDSDLLLLVKKKATVFPTLHQGRVYYPIIGTLLQRERS